MKTFLIALSMAAFLPFTITQAFAVPCVAPQVLSACCNYQIEDQLNNSTPHYYAPNQYFANEDAARAFVKDKYSKIAFVKPMPSSDAIIVGGWHYDGGSHHSAVDYWLANVTQGKDVTSPVVAAAAGRVVTSKWDPWFGNTVVIEHTAASGDVYRTLYMHLRNGGHSDLALALKTPFDPNKIDNWYKYKKFADKGYNALYWGSDANLIKVKAGDTVTAGQVIGTSGNTGAGGAGNGLDSSGNPTNAIRANNHLHFMLSVHPPGSTDWTFIDPYGVYGEAGSGCYSVAKDPAYPRFITPFYPSYFNLPQDQLSRFFYYWPQIGMGPQTISMHTSPGGDLASGAFDAHVGSAWYARLNMDSAALTQWFNTYHAAGFRPRQVSVMVKGNTPYYTVLWQKRAGESYYFWPALSDAEFDAKWRDLVNAQGFHVEDYAAYISGGVTRHAVLFVKDGQDGFYFYRNMDNAAYQAKFNELNGRGYSQTSISVVNVNGQLRFAGIWRVVPGSWAAYANMTPAVFQQKFSEFNAQGFRWHKVVGYQDSTLFGAIWTK